MRTTTRSNFQLVSFASLAACFFLPLISCKHPHSLQDANQQVDIYAVDERYPFQDTLRLEVLHLFCDSVTPEAQQPICFIGKTEHGDTLRVKARCNGPCLIQANAVVGLTEEYPVKGDTLRLKNTDVLKGREWVCCHPYLGRPFKVVHGRVVGME
jgi:hypothetical protein